MRWLLGNPPFYGKQYQSAEQKEDMQAVFKSVEGAGVLDFVTAWYLRAAQYMKAYGDRKTRVAFVSTNSITQGEQVAVLWRELFNKYSCKIHFGYRTFKWGNEAKGKAAVHVVIVGFADHDVAAKQLFEGDGTLQTSDRIRNINPYLVAGNDVWLDKRRQALFPSPEMSYGSMPNDGGHLLMSEVERSALVKNEPNARRFIRRFMMGEELINAIPRYCLWIAPDEVSEIRGLKHVRDRIDAVRAHRMSSSRAATKELAQFPTLFGEMRQPSRRYLALPRVSSENRAFIPLTFLEPSVIAGDKVYTVAGATNYHFGLLTSTMHMAWMRYTAGRLKSDYSYSSQITYNNYPWPEAPTAAQKQAVEAAAQGVLDARAAHKGASLADLYDPLTMPPDLVKAHEKLDKAVDKCYRPQPFASDAKRVEYLFELYERYTSGLLARERTGKKAKKA